jgi:hypothetical protein
MFSETEFDHGVLFTVIRTLHLLAESTVVDRGPAQFAALRNYWIEIMFIVFCDWHLAFSVREMGADVFKIFLSFHRAEIN